MQELLSQSLVTQEQADRMVKRRDAAQASQSSSVLQITDNYFGVYSGVFYIFLKSQSHYFLLTVCTDVQTRGVSCGFGHVRQDPSGRLFCAMDEGKACQHARGKAKNGPKVCIVPCHLSLHTLTTASFQNCDDQRMVLWAQVSRGEASVQALLQQFDQREDREGPQHDLEQETYENSIEDENLWTFSTLKPRQQKQILLHRLCFTFPDSSDFGVYVENNLHRRAFTEMDRRAFIESLPTVLETSFHDCIFCKIPLLSDSEVIQGVYICPIHSESNTCAFFMKGTVYDQVFEPFSINVTTKHCPKCAVTYSPSSRDYAKLGILNFNNRHLLTTRLQRVLSLADTEAGFHTQLWVLIVGVLQVRR